MMKPTNEMISAMMFGAITERLARGLSVADIVSEMMTFGPARTSLRAFEEELRLYRTGLHRLPPGATPALLDALIDELRRRDMN